MSGLFIRELFFIVDLFERGFYYHGKAWMDNLRYLIYPGGLASPRGDRGLC